VTDIKGHVFDLDVWKKMATHLEDLLQGSRLVEHAGYTKVRNEQVLGVLVHRGGGEVHRKTVPRHVIETATTENRFWTDV
jgi:hypothetical protein